MYYSDEPIISVVEDKLGRKNFCKTFAKSIYDLKQIDTFTVGLLGKWGSGKTSLVNMMVSEFKEIEAEQRQQDSIIIRFDPWHFTDSTQLISQFLIRLAEEFRDSKKELFSTIGEALIHYASSFDWGSLIPVPFLNTAVNKIGKFAFESYKKKKQKKQEESKDIIKQKENIVELLRKANRKIVVIIDDIDRLSNEQIRQVFQLVSSVAKFPNTTYLLVFDREIVVNALEKVQEGDGNDYLEKIIQLPIQIPELRKEKLQTLLFNGLDNIRKEYPGVSFVTDRWNKLFYYCIDPFISNIRDINRLLNLLQFKFSTIPSDVDFSDMVAISVVQLSLPKVYDWIKHNKSTVVGEKDWSIGESRKTEQEWNTEYYAIFFRLLHPKTENVVPNDIMVENALEKISILFPPFGLKIGLNYVPLDRNASRKNNNIYNVDKFDRYFDLDLNQIGIKQIVINDAVFSSTVEDLESLIKESNEDDSIYEVLEEIRARIEDISPDRAIVLAQALLQSLCYINKNDERSLFSLSSYSIALHIAYELFEKIDNDKRAPLIHTLLTEMTSDSLDAISSFINLIELAYGRLAAQGQENTGYKKIITIEELEEIEKYYMECSSSILKETSLFNSKDWRMAFHLINSFDKGFSEKLLEKELVLDENVVKFLQFFITEYRGIETSYEMRMPQEYLSEKRILDAISNLKQSGQLFALDIDDQNRAVAFYIYLSDKKRQQEISQTETEELLNKWKKNH